MKNQVLVEILIGLPGSGKTHYAQSANNGEKFLSTFNSNTCYIDFDKDYLKREKRSFTNVLRDSSFCYSIIHHNANYNHWIIDGLFLTNETQHKLVEAIYNECTHYIFDNEHIKIQFVYFKEDRDTCLYNDSIRQQDRKAHITIKHAEFEKPDIDSLSKEFSEIEFVIKEMDVHKMNKYESLFKIHESWKKQDEMRSEEWCLGGTWGNCWGDGGNIGAEAQPSEFTEFDNLLTEICPNISMLQYKKLYRETVTVEERGESDYYGGYCSYGYYACDLKKLYSMLVEMNLIEE